MAYETNIVNKPWGYEYLAYESEDVALWLLYIGHEQSTSMHCHPNKTTGLMVLSGEAEVSFLNNTLSVTSGMKVMIRKGLFHSTTSCAPDGTWLMEIETPVDKHDLVRFRDSYGREGKPYEDQTHEIPKEDSCIWLEDPPLNSSLSYNLSNRANLQTIHITDINYFKDLDDEANVVFLKGGLQTDYGINVAGAGDVVTSKVIKKLMNVFNVLDENTIIMIAEDKC